MKKVFLVSLLMVVAIIVFGQQEQVYISGCHGFYLDEFSKTGTTIKEIMPYTQSGKLYFTSLALPLKSGNLKSGFELFFITNNNNPIGFYDGNQTDKIEKDTPVFVSGFSEKGKIVITNVFPDYIAGDDWIKKNNIKTVSLKIAQYH